jgi:hypothetical protein
MNRKRFEELLDLHLLDELEGADRDAFQAALRGNPKWRAEVERHEKIERLMRSAPAPVPPADLKARVMARARAERLTAATPATAPAESQPRPWAAVLDFFRGQWRLPALASVCLVAVVAIAVLNQSNLEEMKEAAFPDKTMPFFGLMVPETSEISEIDRPPDSYSDTPEIAHTELSKHFNPEGIEERYRVQRLDQPHGPLKKDSVAPVAKLNALDAMLNNDDDDANKLKDGALAFSMPKEISMRESGMTRPEPARGIEAVASDKGVAPGPPRRERDLGVSAPPVAEPRPGRSIEAPADLELQVGVEARGAEIPEAAPIVAAPKPTSQPAPILAESAETPDQLRLDMRKRAVADTAVAGDEPAPTAADIPAPAAEARAFSSIEPPRLESEMNQDMKPLGGDVAADDSGKSGESMKLREKQDRPASAPVGRIVVTAYYESPVTDRLVLRDKAADGSSLWSLGVASQEKGAARVFRFSADDKRDQAPTAEEIQNFLAANGLEIAQTDSRDSTKTETLARAGEAAGVFEKADDFAARASNKWFYAAPEPKQAELLEKRLLALGYRAETAKALGGWAEGKDKTIIAADDAEGRLLAKAGKKERVEESVRGAEIALKEAPRKENSPTRLGLADAIVENKERPASVSATIKIAENIPPTTRTFDNAPAAALSAASGLGEADSPRPTPRPTPAAIITAPPMPAYYIIEFLPTEN